MTTLDLDALQEAAEATPVHAPVHDVREAPYIDIDDRYASRLAILLECMLINPNAFWDEAAALLDEYKAEWEKVNPSPPTFMGEPMPPERKARLQAAIKKRKQDGADSEGEKG